MRHEAARAALAGIATMIAGTGLLAALGGCAPLAPRAPAAHARTTQASEDMPADRAALPMPRSVLKRFPGGTFYFTAGPRPDSFNLWEASNSGREAELTHNPRVFGISEFGASPAGIIMADARSGIDELARLTRKGVVFLKDRDGSGPEINTKGQITYTVPPFGDHPRVFQLRLKNSFSSAARVLYRSRITLGATAWGPRQAIAQVVGGHPPGTKGPRPRLVVVAKNGTTRTIRTRIGNQLSNVIWGDATRTPIAVSGWNSHSEILNPDGTETPLPPGWVPEAWNPSGTMLLVFKLGSSPGIGLWSPRFPRKIHPLGSFSPRVQVGQVAWLAQPARE